MCVCVCVGGCAANLSRLDQKGAVFSFGQTFVHPSSRAGTKAVASAANKTGSYRDPSTMSILAGRGCATSARPLEAAAPTPDTGQSGGGGTTDTTARVV